MIVAGTLDTKGAELRFIRDQIAAAGVRVVLVDLSTSGGPSPADVPPHHVAAYFRGGPNAVFTGDRGAAITAMAEAFEAWIRRQEPVGGLISAGGSGGSSLVAPAMRALPIGVPKVLISSVASGNVAPYVGPADIMMLYSVTDVAGLNSITRQILANGAAAMVGMVKARAASGERERAPVRRGGNRPVIGLTMFGVTTPCVEAIVDALEDDFECLVFHATGIGGQSMEKLVDSGAMVGVIDITTTEVCDLLLGGVLPATEDRFGAIARTRVPYIGSCGALDMVNFGPMDTRARALPRPHASCAQSDGDADAHDAGGKCTHRALDRRAAQSDGRSGPVLPAGRRRFRARRAGPAVLRSRPPMWNCSARSKRPCGRPRRGASSACLIISTTRNFPPKSPPNSAA